MLAHLPRPFSPRERILEGSESFYGSRGAWTALPWAKKPTLRSSASSSSPGQWGSARQALPARVPRARRREDPSQGTCSLGTYGKIQWWVGLEHSSWGWQGRKPKQPQRGSCDKSLPSLASVFASVQWREAMCTCFYCLLKTFVPNTHNVASVCRCLCSQGSHPIWMRVMCPQAGGDITCDGDAHRSPSLTVPGLCGDGGSWVFSGSYSLLELFSSSQEPHPPPTTQRGMSVFHSQTEPSS